MNHSKPLVITMWATRVIAAAILVMGALPKFTGGADALAAKLPGGTASTMFIGLVEIVAVVLILVPKTSLIGSALAALIMFGAIGSHLVGPVGMEGDMATMFGMAVVAFLAAAAATALSWRLKVGLPGASFRHAEPAAS